MSRKKNFIAIMAASSMALGLMAAGCGSGSDDPGETRDTRVYVPMVKLNAETCPAPVAWDETTQGALPENTKLGEDGFLVAAEPAEGLEDAWVDEDGQLLAKCELKLDATWTNNGKAAASTRVYNREDSKPDTLTIQLPPGTKIAMTATLTHYAVDAGAFVAEGNQLYDVSIKDYLFASSNTAPNLTLYLNQTPGEQGAEEKTLHFTSLTAEDNEGTSENDSNFHIGDAQGTITFTVTLADKSDTTTKLTVVGETSEPNCGAAFDLPGDGDAADMRFKGTWRPHANLQLPECIITIKATGTDTAGAPVEEVTMPVKVYFGTGGDGDRYTVTGSVHFNDAPAIAVSMKPFNQISARDIDQPINVAVEVSDPDSLDAVTLSLSQVKYLSRPVDPAATPIVLECLKAEIPDAETISKTGDGAGIPPSTVAKYGVTFSWGTCDGLDADEITEMTADMDVHPSITFEAKAVDAAPADLPYLVDDLTVSKFVKVYVIDPQEAEPPVTQ